jgi:hypothetical protein
MALGAYDVDGDLSYWIQWEGPLPYELDNVLEDGADQEAHLRGIRYYTAPGYERLPILRAGW